MSAFRHQSRRLNFSHECIPPNPQLLLRSLYTVILMALVWNIALFVLKFTRDSERYWFGSSWIFIVNIVLATSCILVLLSSLATFLRKAYFAQRSGRPW